ncbi:MAG: ABC transporter permease [Spirochaetia bacterium]|nr:ABC transporter permease [Spirochaetia bacterium]MCF7953601.1 ABC transporter permease [Spirochaetales bacterium]
MKLKTIRDVDFSKYAALIALIIIFIIASLSSPYFLKGRNLLNILRQVSYTGIIGLGMTFVIISGGIDLSVGSMTAFVGGLAILVLNAAGATGFSIFLAILAALVIGAASGAFNGFIVTRFKIASFIVTLGSMSIFRSLTLYFVNAGEYRSESPAYQNVGSGLFLGVPIPVWVFIGLTILLHLLLNHTRYGRYICAVGANEQVARYSAIKTRLVRFMAYVITGLTVGVTAVMLSSRLNSISSSNAGNAYELDAIAAVVIGGTSMSGGSGTVIGTVLGAVILGIINNMLNMMGVSPYLQGTVKGLVIIFAVLLQYKKNKSS